MLASTGGDAITYHGILWYFLRYLPCNHAVMRSANLLFYVACCVRMHARQCRSMVNVRLHAMVYMLQHTLSF